MKAARHPVELLDYSECHLAPSAEEMGRQAALLLTACKAHLAALASAPHLAKAILALVLAAALAVARRPSLPLLCARHLRKYYRTIQRDRGWRRFSAKLCMLEGRTARIHASCPLLVSCGRKQKNDVGAQGPTQQKAREHKATLLPPQRAEPLMPPTTSGEVDPWLNSSMLPFLRSFVARVQ